MGKKGQVHSGFLEFFQCVDNPACIVDDKGNLQEANTAFSRLIRSSFSPISSLQLKFFFSDSDYAKIKKHLVCSDSFETGRVDGVVCTRGDKYKNVFDLKIIPLFEDNQFMVVFSEVISKKIATGLSETGFRHTLLGMLTTGVSHDINNKLSVILGHTALAAKKTGIDDELKIDLKNIQKAAFGAANLVQSLVKFSRAKDDEETLVDPFIVIKEISKFARSVVPSTIKIVERFENDCGLVKARMASLNSLIILIISEAIQSLRAGGEFRIELGQENQNNKEIGKVFLNFICTGDYARSVPECDRGIRRDRLMTIESLASVAGGRVSLQNNGLQNSGGIKLIFDKQEKVIKPDQEIVKKNVPDSALLTGEKILLVEDEPMLARLLKRALEKSGYKVTITGDGKEGLNAWMSAEKSFDLILTDMTMPEMSGTELAEKILAQQSDAKIILCTGFSDQVDEVEAKRLGIKHYLEKPVGNRVLLFTIRQCLDSD